MPDLTYLRPFDPERFNVRSNQPTMKAVVTTGNGGYEKLDYRDVPIPVPGPGEVLLRVLAPGLITQRSIHGLVGIPRRFKVAPSNYLKRTMDRRLMTVAGTSQHPSPSSRGRIAAGKSSPGGRVRRARRLESEFLSGPVCVLTALILWIISGWHRISTGHSLNM